MASWLYQQTCGRSPVDRLLLVDPLQRFAALIRAFHMVAFSSTCRDQSGRERMPASRVEGKRGTPGQRL